MWLLLGKGVKSLGEKVEEVTGPLCGRLVPRGVERKLLLRRTRGLGSTTSSKKEGVMASSEAQLPETSADCCRRVEGAGDLHLSLLVP